MSKRGSSGSRGKSKTYLSYLLLGATALMLGISIVLIQGWKQKIETEAVALPVPELEKPTEPAAAPKVESAEPEIQAKPENTAKSVESFEPENTAARPAPDAPKIYIVIDDVGNSIEELKPFLSLPLPITFAVMPQRRYTRDTVELIRQAKKYYIMHQPMEPVGDADPGVGAIYTGMSKEEVYATLDANLATLGGAPGINNHMGSKATADAETMRVLMEYLKKLDMFFLDSLTTGDSVAENIAAEISLPYMKRNSMFLDNEREREYIERALRSGFSLAETSGRAVMIGHVWDEHLADLLLELYPEFVEKGFSFDDIGSMLYLGRPEAVE